jgi:hypothetical protein
MRQFTLCIILIVFYQFTSAQFIEQVYIGESLEKTIELGKERGHEYLETKGDIASFCVVSHLGTARLNVFASPESKTVWFGTSNYITESKQENIDKFEKIKQMINEKYGDPYQIKRKEISWDNGHAFIILKKKKKYVQYSVVSTGAFHKTMNEF